MWAAPGAGAEIARESGSPVKQNSAKASPDCDKRCRAAWAVADRLQGFEMFAAREIVLNWKGDTVRLANQMEKTRPRCASRACVSDCTAV